jgi:hypothetical protein
VVSRTVKGALRVLGALLVLAGLGCGILLWRLSSGPLSLGFVTPYLEAMLAASLPNHKVDILDTVLAWDRQDHQLDVQARHVVIVASNGTTVAAFPVLDVSLSLRALLHGTVALTAVDVADATVKLVRSADGSFRLRPPQAPGIRQSAPTPAASQPQQPADAPGHLVQQLLEALLSAPVPSRPLAYLQEVRVVHSGAEILDAASKRTWKASQLNLSLHRTTAGLQGTFNVTLNLQGTSATIDTILRYARDTQRIEAEISFSELPLAELAPLMAPVADLSGLDVPLSGALTVSLDPRLTLHDLRFAIRGGAGTLAYPAIMPGPLPITALQLDGRLDGQRQRLHLQRAVVTLPSEARQAATVRLKGTATGLDGDITVAARLRLAAVRLEDLTSRLSAVLGISLPARFTKHPLGGTIDEAQASIGLRMPAGKFESAVLTALDASLHVQPVWQNSRPMIDATVSFDAATKRLRLRASYTKLQPAVVAAAIPTLPPLDGLEAPFEGSVVLEVDQTWRLHALRFETSGGPGRLRYPELFPKPPSLSNVAVRGHFEPSTAVLHIDQLTVGLGAPNGPRFQARGTVESSSQGVSLQAEASLTDFRIADLGTYWPAGVSRKARAWLTENLVAGTVDQARMHLALVLPGQTTKGLTIKRLDGTMRYRDCEVHYLRPLPPMTGVSGQASFNQKGFQIRVESGAGADLRLANGDIQITGLEADRDAMAIRMQVQGPLRAALRLLDHPQLHLLAKLGLDPATTSGQADVQTAFAFSLRGTVHLDDVEVTAQATLSDVAMQNVLLGQDAEHGQLSLDLDKTGMTVKGPIVYAAIPIQLDWHEAFTRQGDWRSTMRAHATHLPPAALSGFGLDLSTMVAGSLAATVTSRTPWQGEQVIEADVDLGPATLHVPFLGWRKPSGIPGRLQGTVQVGAQQGQGAFFVTGETLTTHGTVSFGLSQPAETRVEFRDLRIAGSQLDTVSVTHQEQRTTVRLGAGVLDASFFMPSGASDVADGAAPWAEARQALREQPTSLHVLAPSLRQVRFGAGRYLEAVTFELRRSSGGWEIIDIAGRVPEAANGGHFTVRYLPAAGNTYKLSVRIADLGALLRASNLREGIQGGSTTLTGRGTGPLPSGSVQGTLLIEDMRVTNAPMLARILSAASLNGLHDLLNGEGLLFNQVTGELVMQDTSVTSELVRAQGGGLGLTAEGDLNLDTKTLDVKGTVIPVRGLNTLPGKIPLIGKLIVGGEGEGLIAVNYRLQGALADPKVTVNPASALTPGFLRKVFDIFDGDKPSEGQ